MNPEGPSLMANLVPIVLIFGIFYFLIIRPQQKQEKERQKMIEALAKGDKVLTTSGIIGTIADIKGNKLEVKIAENVKVTMLRSAIVSLASDKEETLTPQPAK